MEEHSITLNLIIFISTFSLLLLTPQANTDLKTYIIQLHPQGSTSSLFDSKLQWHLSFLQQTLSSEQEEQNYTNRLLYSYSTAMEGFAAQLSETELQNLQKLPDVVSVRSDRKHEIQTTYSYKFMGLDVDRDNVWYKSAFGQGAIIGILDTGVWPESPSFSDSRMPPIPKKWRGVCQEGQDFNSSHCNRKLIGARFFIKGHHVASSSSDIFHEYISPRDSHGHGTHTSSTAAGASVPSASVLGSASGVARGIAPAARVSIYKVCWFSGCFSSDILAAIDSAITDGVNILSLSLGSFPVPLFDDSIAIATFRATQHGISVICAAGNNGPFQSSVSNSAPWISTIGASTLNRKFPAILKLSNGASINGESISIAKNTNNLEVVYGEFCLKGLLLREKVEGKMVVCDRGINGRAEKGQVVKESGGVAMILANTEMNKEEDSVDVHVIPATLIGFAEAKRLKRFMNSTAMARARIEFGGTVIGKTRDPAVAEFSGRGPSIVIPSILKPDLIAPGVNIIAAWPQNLGPTGLPEDFRRVNFTVMSGTSMACPHVSGITALLHSTYPKWRPAAIKSAMMTTAEVTDHHGGPILDGNKIAGPFAIGAGHVNPVKAMDPGLVYDIKPEEYIIHLCTLDYTNQEIFTITHMNVSCRRILQINKGFSLNYPSMAVIFKAGTTEKTISRRLTNVGMANSTYTVEIAAPEGVRVRVKPQRLVFKKENQSLKFRVRFVSEKRGRGKKMQKFAQGHLTWVNGKYRVRSVIAVTWK